MDTFNNLSTPVKAGVALASGAGLVGSIALLTGGNGTVLLIMAMGIVLVGLLLVAYKFVLGWLGKRKAAPLERGILNNSAASPNSISEPARRARMDDLRRSFENGVEKFRASGKNIYSLPWYALVGEPGSGKTEAIRHCNVGFPPGLQDQLQGAGGTLNMNWWFTNHAIILDTAGRLMFEEVEPGATSEWKEFLTLLTKVRPNCPINGMLLVIPADSLIRDTADSIERKAGKIAQQLDSIQRLLGVRFPVFIVITKADLINGFREFFDTLSDPQLQHQIMGWSNPAPLDQPFSPDLVEKHLQTVAASLSKRRQGLLIDPVNTEDPNGRRVDQVDALYAFPESLLKIGPRLRRYLEMVFVAGEWSPKPLFLRGIYFTSSMREGSALDAELAEALKVPIESLPEGKVWERDRAYFLRDLFIQKVFKEKGLVTRASDTKKLQRHRKLAVLVTAFIGVFLLLGLTWYGARTLDKSIGDQKEYWSAASSEYADSADKWALFDTKSKPAKYLGDSEIRVMEKIPRARFHSATYDMLQSRIYVPLIFRPLSAFSGNLNEKRSTSYRAMFEVSVLQPLVKAARDKISLETPATWNERATLALAQLVRMETYAANATPVAAAEPPMNLDPLARYVLEKDDEYNAFRTKHEKAFQSSLEFLYTTKDGGGKWLPPGLSANLPVVSKGVDTFNQYWTAQLSEKSPRFMQINALVDALRRFKIAEGAVGSAAKNPTDTADQFKSFAENWGRGFSDLSKAKEDADRSIENLSRDNRWPEGNTLASVVEAEASSIVRDANRAYQALSAHLPADDKTAASTPVAKLRGDLKDAQAKIAIASNALTNDPARSKTIAELDQIYLPRGKDIDKNQSRRYVIHYQAYSRANDQLKPGTAAASSFSTIAGDLKKIDGDMDSKLFNDVNALPSGFTTDQAPIKTACDTALAVGDIAARQKRYELLSITLKTSPQNAQQVAQAIAAGAGKFEPLTHRKVPLTAFAKDDEKFLPDYHPDAAKEYISGWKAVGTQLADAKAKPHAGVLNAAELSTAYDATNKPIADYLKSYTNYWTDDLRDSLKVAEFPSWSGIFTNDLKTGQWEVKALVNVWAIDEASRKALNAVLTPQTMQSLGLPPALTEREYGVLQERTIKCVSRWRSLGDNAEDARRAVLEIPQVDFESGYLFPEDEKARLAERYVFQYSLRMLEALANESKKTARASLDKLRQLSRFPLARPEKNVPTLKETEVAEARMLYSKIKMGDVNVGTTPRPVAARDASTVETLLRTLRQLDLNRDDAIFIQRTGALLKALPELGKPLNCTITWLPMLKQAQYGTQAKKKVPFEMYPYGELIQSVEVPRGKWLHDRNLTYTKEGSSVGEVTIPGDPIRFRLSPYSTFSNDDKPYVWPDLAAKQYDTTAPYTCLRLLHQENVPYRSDDGLIWHVELPVDAASSFWIELKFETKIGIPDLKDWPDKSATPRP